MLWFRYLPYRIRSWWDWKCRTLFMRKKYADRDMKHFRFMTLPNYPQIDPNVTCHVDDGLPYTLNPFNGIDVK